MNLLEKIKEDMVTSMKSKDKDRLAVLRMIKGAMQLENINNKKEIDEELLIDTVSKQIKMRNDSIVEFEKGKREDLINKTKSEIEILKEYLPRQLTVEEVNQIIDEAFKKINPMSSKDMGLIMKEINPILKGKTDLKDVTNIIKEKLSNL